MRVRRRSQFIRSVCDQPLPQLARRDHSPPIAIPLGLPLRIVVISGPTQNLFRVGLPLFFRPFRFHLPTHVPNALTQSSHQPETSSASLSKAIWHEAQVRRLRHR